MEQAIFISRIKGLEYVTKQYSRLYFGNEFCEQLIPAIDELRRVLDFTVERAMDYTLVTPYLTNKGLEKLMPLIKLVIEQIADSEIVINDWGLLRVLNNEYGNLNLVLGRLLTKQKRGPRILNLVDRVPLSMFEHFKECNADVPILSDFLIEKGIRRIELDNLLQGVIRRSPKIKGSIYIPFAYVTTTRYCLASLCENDSGFFRSIRPCNKECQRYVFRLQHKQMPVDLLLQGNTQFFKNEKLPDNLDSLEIDRVVYQPELPI